MESGTHSLCSHLRHLLFLFFFFFFFLLFVTSGVTAINAAPGDAAAMLALAKSLDFSAAPFKWDDSEDPCKWSKVTCVSGRVQAIQIGNSKITGSLPPDIRNLSALTRLEVMSNSIAGPLPSFAGLSSLQTLLLSSNAFTSIPADFFTGLSALQVVYLDQNPFSLWSIPNSLRDCLSLVAFYGNNVNLNGEIPSFLGDAFAGLRDLALSGNHLTGGIPSSFSGSGLELLWLNGNSYLNGSISVVGKMSSLKQLWLNGNSFSGPLPDFSNLFVLENLCLRDNQLTGPVPASLTMLKSLQVLNLTNNFLQGPVPEFSNKSLALDLDNTLESFCRVERGNCDPRVDVLISIAGSFGYPFVFAQNWKGNDPCKQWRGITCDLKGNVIVVNFDNLHLSGTISTNFSSLTNLRDLVLSNNNITGTIPSDLTKLASLELLDLSNNGLWGQVPPFGKNITVKTVGNPNIGRDGPPSNNSSDSSDGNHKKSKTGAIAGFSVAILCIVCIALAGFCYFKRKKIRVQKHQKEDNLVVHRSDSGSEAELLKISVAHQRLNSCASSLPFDPSNLSEVGSMTISIDLLRSVTNNFSEENILGRGGFGTVYKGELSDGTKIAVKRMNVSNIGGSKGMDEFKSEISVLTKVRHRHLVSLLGYCLESDEKILVFEYMPNGALSDHLFNWERTGLKPLQWPIRLSIALDVARGVEYLHTLASQRFIHRDLKSANILIGDDMRAKVADFGLVRLAPEGTFSVETRIAGTFGYLAPEYATTGRVTTKSDVYSYGVILMELITGRRAMDNSQPEESKHLVSWFRRLQMEKESLWQAIDPTIKVNDEVFENIKPVASLAWHCCGRDPHQRPDMSYAVNVLSSLAESWKPSESQLDDEYDIDFDLHSINGQRYHLSSQTLDASSS